MKMRIGVATTTKMTNIFSFAVVLNYKILSISIGNINISVCCNSSFCWNVFISFCVLSCFFGITQCHQYPAINCCFKNFMQVVIADI